MKGLVKSEAPQEEEIQPHIDCTGDLQVFIENCLLGAL